MHDLEWGGVTASLSVTLSSQDTAQSTAAIAHLRLWLICAFCVPHGDFKINTTFTAIQQKQLPASARSCKDRGHQFFVKRIARGNLTINSPKPCRIPATFDQSTDHVVRKFRGIL